MGNVQSEMQHLANQLSLAGPEEKKFLQAVYENKPELAAALLKSHPNSIYARTDSWYNAWHIAAQSGSLPMLEVLYKHGSSGTRKPLPGEPPQHSARTKVERETPLMIALAANNMTAVQFLLSVGASPTDQDRYGNTVVHYAALRGQIKILEMLLASAEGMIAEAGPNSQDSVTNYTELRNEAGLQPLHYAVWGGKQDAAKILLQYKADMLARSSGDSMSQVTCNSGSTPLHVAAQRNDVEMAKFLLEAYVQALNEGRAKRQDPRTVTDNYRSTPWAVAVSLKRDAVAPVLDPNFKFPGMEAALSHAATLANMAPELRKTLTRGRTSNSSINAAAALAAVATASGAQDGSALSKGGKAGGAPAARDLFDGFAQLAAGSSTSGGGASPSLKDGAHVGSVTFRRDSRDSVGGADKPKLAVPVLAPPPPKAGKVAGAVPILSPPPGTKTVPQAPHSPAVPTAAAATPGHATATTASATAPAATTAAAAPVAQPPAAAPAAAGVASHTPPAATAPPAASVPARAVAAAGSVPVPVPALQPAPEAAPPATPAAAAPAPAAPAPAATTAVAESKPTSTEPKPPAAEQLPAVAATPAAPAPAPAAAPAMSSSGRASEGGVSSAPAGPPARFLCPITNNIMVDPVTACDGRTYERDAVEMWFELGNANFPGSGSLITFKTVKPNMALRAEIAAWKSAAAQ